MKMATPIVLTKVVENDLCIGCGACVQACPSKALSITWDNHGFLVATATEQQCEEDGACLSVCPFNPELEAECQNEDALAEDFLIDTTQKHRQIGRYHNIYAGYSKKYRPSSSSGGIATFVYEKLFDIGVISHVITVGEASTNDAHYEYNIVSSKNDLLRVSKTRYHPVTLADSLEKIKNLDGKVAISGVGCFIKAIRLAQRHDPLLKEKIVFLVGIICGGVKSKFFTEYLAAKAGVLNNDFSNPEYRIKDPLSTAADYSFGCKDNQSNENKNIKMRDVGEMWGTGLFKANACDFCDDVTTELADISLGDAWLPPYNKDGLGHSVIVTRSVLADKILLAGQESEELELEDLALSDFLRSQQGSFNHRHDAIGLRATLAKKEGFSVPIKRFGYEKLPAYLTLVQVLRRKVRRRSLFAWAKYQDPKFFDKNMKPVLFELKVVTKASHVIRKIKNKIGGQK